MKLFQKNILVDFDGTITQEGKCGPQEIPPPRKNVAEVMQRWIDEGYIVTINTLRCDFFNSDNEWVDGCKKYLERHEIPYSAYNENPQPEIDEYGSDSRKLTGSISIDDRNLGGIPEDFEDIYILVRKQIGLPYVMGKDGEFMLNPYEAEVIDNTCIPSNLAMAPSGITAMFSRDFMEKTSVNPLYHMVYSQLLSGANPYGLIEELTRQLTKSNNLITQTMVNVANHPDIKKT